MAPSARVALRPYNEATRQSGEIWRVTTVFYGNVSSAEHNPIHPFAQRLSDRFGLTSLRARLLTELLGIDDGGVK